jgi:uncharacterized membrane protein
MQYWIQQASQWIGYLGVLIVIIGVIDMAIRLIVSFTSFGKNAAKLRSGLMAYLELSLDFFIAKDIISLSLDNRDYNTIISIVIIIGVGVMLSYFIHLEEKAIRAANLLSKKTNKIA